MKRVAFVAGLILLVVALYFLRPRPGAKPQPASPKSPAAVAVGVPASTKPAEESISDSSLNAARPESDPVAARRALSRALESMPPHRAAEWAQNLEALHGGASAEFREFARAFLSAAGDRLLPVVKSLLAECESDEARFLLAAVLGESRRPDVIPLLQEFVTQNPGPVATAAALYSIGMANAPEGLMYLTAWLDTARDSKSRELDHVLRPALMAVGLHGADAMDYLLDAAARRKGGQMPSPADVVGWIRGESAFDRLRTILESEENWDLKRGAMTALGCASYSRALDFFASFNDPAMTAQGLLAARHLPDVWESTGARRSSMASDLLKRSGAPTGDWKVDAAYVGLATFLSPGEAKPLYEALTASVPPEGQDLRAWISTLVSAFGTQPDLDARMTRLAQSGKLNRRDLQRAIEIGLERGVLPGRELGTSALGARLLATATDPATPNWMSGLALRPVMRSGIPEAVLSAALDGASRTFGQTYSLLGAITQSKPVHYPPLTLQYTQPESYLEAVLNRESEPMLRMRAAFAYLMDLRPASPDPEALRAVAALVHSGDVGRSEAPEVTYIMPRLLGTWYARFGTREDLAKLATLPDHYPLPSNISLQYRGEFRKLLALELKRSVDAIRLRSN